MEWTTGTESETSRSRRNALNTRNGVRKTNMADSERLQNPSWAGFMEVVRRCVTNKTYESEGAYKSRCRRGLMLACTVGRLGIDERLA